jgi:hypothetical protein
LGCAGTLAALSLLPALADQVSLRWTFLTAALVLGAWNGLLLARVRRSGRLPAVAVALRPQHYIQACAQGALFLYWGWYWREVYDAAHLLAAQLLFAWAFDLLLSWTRRDACTLSLGTVPIVFSINLFLWFADDWFHFQFLLVAIGFAAKELIRWERDGRLVHIFNPASFPLAVFAAALIVTGMSGVTRAQDIAISQFYPPQMFLWIFLIALPGQYLFGVTTMTMAAVVSTYLFGLAYFAATGVYFFYDSYIPIAVFLGMHLLFTDPSTSPRTELGRMLFGVLYGLSTVVLYVVLGQAGAPTFYDKLLQVPVLNLSVILIDRAARSAFLRRFDPAALGRSLAPRRRHLAYMGVWAVVFAGISAAGGVGDRHPGQWVPFWQEACEEGRPHACGYLAAKQSGLCNSGSGWACNEAGVLQAAVADDGAVGEDREGVGQVEAMFAFQRGCELGFEAACGNYRTMLSGGGGFERGPPTVEDYPILLRGSKGEITDREPATLYVRACRQGWVGACESVR